MGALETFDENDISDKNFTNFQVAVQAICLVRMFQLFATVSSVCFRVTESVADAPNSTYTFEIEKII